MKNLFVIIVAVLMLSACAQAQPSSLALPTAGSTIYITPLMHASLQIENGEKVIQVDPTKGGNAMNPKKADLILITDIHGDHLDEAAMNEVATAKTLVIAPQAVIAQLKGFKGRLIRLDNGQTKDNVPGYADISIEAVPMYNLQRGPKPDQKYHDKGRGNGYVLTMSGQRLYIAGDTEVTPEMQALKNIDVAFLPMNLPYTMTPQEAAAGAKVFKPRFAIPFHYRAPADKINDNPQQFEAALKGSGIVVSLLDWYPETAVAVATAK